MILLDTHMWVWWVDESPQLSAQHKQLIEEHEPDGLGVSAISCWEVAKLVERGRLQFACPIEEWMAQALAYPGIVLLPLTPAMAIASTTLPGHFHRDPADQIIVATARVHDLALLTMDRLILDYPYVRTL